MFISPSRMRAAAAGSRVLVGDWTEAANSQAVSARAEDAHYFDGRFVMVGRGANTGDGILYTSDDEGQTWTKRTDNAGGYLRGVTHGNGVWVAVGGSVVTDPAIVVSSADGTTWTLRTTPSGVDGLYSVAYDPVIELFCAVGDANSTTSQEGSMMTSSDGTTWTNRNNSTTDCDLRGIASNGNGLFVAVGGSSTGRIFTSPDGINWTERLDTGVANLFHCVAYSKGVFVALNQGVSPNFYKGVYTSPDGVTWTERSDIEVSSGSFAVAASRGTFVAIMTGGSGATSYVSTDGGISWTEVALPASSSLINPCCGAGPRNFVMGGQAVVEGDLFMAYSSPD